MGFVYDVEDISVGKRYVLKTLTPELLGRRDLARRMEAEARVLARLSHPNVVDVITAGTTQDEQRMPYFVMERLNGQSLRTVLDKKGALDFSLTCRIGIDVLDALEHAHDNGVIHRDVKPDNVFLHRTAVGTTITKLLDFGVMRLVDSNLDDTRGRFVGTLRYAAPEQILTKEVGRAADLYATALVLYELVCGRGPFDEIDEMVLLANAHVNEAPPPLSQFVAVPREFEDLIMGALSKDPEGRPRDAFTFAAELRKLLKASQRAVEATSARTAIAPLSSAGTPAMATGSVPLAPSTTSGAEDPLSALAAVSSSPQQDGLQAYAKTLAGETPGEAEATRREGVAAAGLPNFAATMRISEHPPGLRPHPGVDRQALTKSFVAEPLPRPLNDTLQVEPGAFQVAEALPIVFPPERPSPTTTSAMTDGSTSQLAPRPAPRTGLVAFGLVSAVGLGAILLLGWRATHPGGASPSFETAVSAGEPPTALTASVVPAPQPSAGAPSTELPALAPVPSASVAAAPAPVAAGHKPSAPKSAERKPAASAAAKPERPNPSPKPAANKPSRPPGVDF